MKLTSPLAPTRFGVTARTANTSSAGAVQSPLRRQEVARPGAIDGHSVASSYMASKRARATRIYVSLSPGQPERTPVGAQELKSLLNKLNLSLPVAVTSSEDTPELKATRCEIAEAVDVLMNDRKSSVMHGVKEAIKTGDALKMEALLTLIRTGVIDPNNGVSDEFDPLRRALLKACDEQPDDSDVEQDTAEAPKRLSVHERVGKLVEAGMNIELRTDDMQTLLHLAAEEPASPELLRALIEHGVYVSSQNQFRQTPLHAALWEPENVEAASILLSYGAHTNIRDKLDRTPLVVAASAAKPEMIQAVIDKMKERGEDIDAPDSAGMTALHYAANSANREDAIAVLVRNGANSLAQDMDGNTPRYDYTQKTGKPWDF